MIFKFLKAVHSTALQRAVSLCSQLVLKQILSLSKGAKRLALWSTVLWTSLIFTAMTNMTYDQAYEMLGEVGQQHLLDNWENLTDEKQKQFLNDIASIDTSIFKEQKAILNQQTKKDLKIEVFDQFSISGNVDDYEKGLKAISEGKVGCLLIAGGQGTRFRSTAPKGLFPVSVIKNKSLFQLFAEKTAAASKQADRPLSLAIMTSPLNHDETVSYFKKNNYFGLQPGQVSFFTQSMLPFLDANGNMLLDQNDKLAKGPDGNGFSLYHFYHSGIWKEWQKNGIKHVNYVLIDNPLADPFDAELMGFHIRQNDEITLKSVERIDPMEKVGVIIRNGGKAGVIEYSEISKEDALAKDANGYLKHRCANISLFCFNMLFIEKAAHQQLTLHTALKSLSNDNPVKIWKFERFIFDLLPYADKVSALVYPRELCFAPLKNVEGQDSLETVQKALLNLDRITFKRISGLDAEGKTFELSQDFHYPTKELLSNWKGKPLPDESYINP